MTTRKCSICGADKPDRDFAKIRNMSWCKACHAERERKRRAGMTAEQKQAANAKTRKWRQSHPLFVRASAMNKRAAKLGATGKVYESDILKCFDAFGGRCWVCGDAATEVDHFIPVNRQAGGTNTADNIRPICRECNQKRSHEWHGEAVAVKEAKLLRKLKRMLKIARTVQPFVGHSESEGAE